MTIAEEKQAQRTAGRAARKALDAPQRAAANAALCRRVLELDAYRAAHTLLLYAAFGGEADLAAVAAEAVRQGKTVAYPVCGEGFSLTAAVPGADGWAVGQYGIRTPVPDFLGYMAEKKRDFQKIQIFFHTREERMRYEAELSGPLGDLNLTSSCANNIEINSRLAAKGEAMAALCRTLGFGPENAMCFGDGTNDISMLRLAGVGVAMENAEPCVKEAADVVTASCDEDGVAQMIERTLL